MRYRRTFVPGGSFFFTLVTENRRPLFSNSDTLEVLRAAFRTVQAKRPFCIDAIVVLPDHIHAIWTLPPGDGDFSTRWRLIKTWFSKHCDPALGAFPNNPRRKKRGQGLWQHRFWEHTLRDDNDYLRHVEYIHFNPVKHGYVLSASNWRYSSFHLYVEKGLYPKDWGRGELDFEGIGRE